MQQNMHVDIGKELTTIYELGMNGSGTLHLKEKVQVY
jgi:hypothetical protein